jgi:hypothetical protein
LNDPPRRKYARANRPTLTVIVRSEDGRTALCTVENVSAGGALLVGHAPELRVGDLVRLVLKSDGRILNFAANVVRLEQHDQAFSIAVAFVNVAADVEEHLARVVTSVVEQQRRASPNLILIVSATQVVRDLLVEDLAQHGWSAVAVKTPLEAIWQLDDRSRRFGTALVDFDREPAAALDILIHLIVSHRDIRRILLSNQDPATLARETSSWRAHACLRVPWTRAALAAAIGPRVT